MAGLWTKLTVEVKTEDIEIVSAIMSMLSNSLMIEDYSDFSFNGMYGELVDEEIKNADKDRGKVSLFVPEEKNLSEYTAFLTERFASLSLDTKMTLDGVNEDDWAESWKKYYQPVHLGNVSIVPAWQDYTAKEGETVVRMDPGMAFGTGTHETTRLVLRLMQGKIHGGERVLDIGTGSGILSITARKLGAASASAYDIDPVAVKVARENVKTNGCDRIDVGVSDLLKDVDLTQGKYDFCVANIVSDIILRMLPDLDGYMNPKAPVILSGIIMPRADEIRVALKENGYRILEELTENDWISMVAVKE